MTGREALSIAYHVLTGNGVLFTSEHKQEAAKKLSVFINWQIAFPIPVGELLRGDQAKPLPTENDVEDTRELFERLTYRKPSSWSEIPIVNFADLSEEQKQAFRGLPEVHLGGRSPMSTNPLLKRDHQYEYHGIRGIDHFYVNTEGYDYARHAFRVTGL